MRKYLVLVLAFALFINVSNSFGQQTINHVADKSNNQVIDKTILSGHFEIEKANKERGIMDHINVNYALSPVPFCNVLNLELSTPDPVIFTAAIVDLNDRKLVQWKAEGPDYIHKSRIDISKLEPGNYKVNIYWEKSEGLLYSIPFQKNGKDK